MPEEEREEDALYASENDWQMMQQHVEALRPIYQKVAQFVVSPNEVFVTTQN